MSVSRLLILFIVIALPAVSGCSSDGGSGSIDPDGDQSVTDGDAPVADGDRDADPIDGDVVDGDASDGDAPDGDEADGDETDRDVSDGDAIDGDEPDGDEIDGDSVDSDMDIPPALNNPHFSGFTAAGGTASSDAYRLIFRLAPAAITMKATGGGYRMNATITPKSN